MSAMEFTLSGDNVTFAPNKLMDPKSIFLARVWAITLMVMPRVEMERMAVNGIWVEIH